MISKCLQYQGLALLWFINANQMGCGIISAGHAVIGMVFMVISICHGVGEAIELRRRRNNP